jgi:predicted hydrocarbon binding protein
MNGLDEELDEQTKTKILENCGRTCIPRSFVKKAQDYKKKAKNTDDFLNSLGKAWKHLKRENNDVHVVYEKCYCPIVKTHNGKLSPTWCNCSRGWIKELFESALEKSVDVVLEKSIMRGDDMCKFTVHL